MSVESVTGCLHGDLHKDTGELARMLADDREVIESGVAKIIPEERFTNADGDTRILRTIKIPYETPGQRRRAVLGMAIDITDQRNNQQRLAASESKYRALLENAVDAILLADTSGNLIDANRRAELLLGYTKDELRRMCALDLHPPEEHARVGEVFESLNKAKSTLVLHPVLRKDGVIIQVEVAATLIDCGEQRIVQGIFRDVSERQRQAEQRLVEEKLHRNTLVREVHHRIKNNLQGVVGLLREHANMRPELNEAIKAAIGQVQSISVVYGLHGQGDDQEVSLHDMVQAIVRNNTTLAGMRVEPKVGLGLRTPFHVNKEEAVSIALVINELMLNAMKHSADNAAGNVQVYVGSDATGAEVMISNLGRIPAGFDYEQGRGIGTGLGLVRSLLPRELGRLEFKQNGPRVEARLKLALSCSAS
jgi:PAS domain S-box-containing protein